MAGNIEMKRTVWSRFLWPPRDKWPGAIARLLIIAAVLFIFRFGVFAWLVAGHNLLWKSVTRSARNHEADVDFLCRLRAPGVRMLLRIDQADALPHVEDPDALPELLRVARAHPNTMTRVHAFEALSRASRETAT